MKRKKKEEKSKDKRKAQAAMEFLMTYGWAILVVLVAIATLAYFGVLTPEKLLPERCTLEPGLSCKNFRAEAESVSLLLGNHLGEDIENITVSIPKTGCSRVFNITLPDDTVMEFTIPCNLSEWGKLKSDIKVDYYIAGFKDFKHGAIVVLVFGGKGRPKPKEKTCIDKTPYDKCSTTKPLYCDNGTLINNCSICGCPINQTCNSTTGSCYALKCSDSTPYESCSTTKPLYCENGSLVNKCSICGCSANQTCQADESCIIPTPPLVLYMPFECDAKDYSGYGNNGTIYGATFVAGKVDNALQFDGVDDYVDCGNATSLNISQAITIEAWIKPSSAQYYGYFVAKDDTSLNRLYDFKFETNKIRSLFWDSNGTLHSLYSDSTLNLNQWYHVVTTYDGSVQKNYINGNQEPSTLSWNGTIKTNANIPVRIGGIGNWPFNGAIDEVRIYPYALSAEQIQAHYQSELSQIGEFKCTGMCPAGTPYGNCSAMKPLYCENGTLIDKCSVCGCPAEQTCQTNGSCITPECNSQYFWVSSFKGSYIGGLTTYTCYLKPGQSDRIRLYFDTGGTVTFNMTGPGNCDYDLYLDWCYNLPLVSSVTASCNEVIQQGRIIQCYDLKTVAKRGEGPAKIRICEAFGYLSPAPSCPV